MRYQAIHPNHQNLDPGPGTSRKGKQFGNTIRGRTATHPQTQMWARIMSGQGGAGGAGGGIGGAGGEADITN
jgi:hypothetical protein